MAKELKISKSPAVRKHFCKNYNLPIKIFEDPYFTDRCLLFDEQFGVLAKMDEYVEDFNKYENEQAFFSADNRILQSIIDYLKGNEKMIYFSQKEDMNKYSIPENYRDIPSKDIWNDSNVGKVLMSIDLKKANFQALKYYSKDIFGGAETWEEFMKKFTDEKSKIHSKHLRQVIFGSINPKRQITLEKNIMCRILYYCPLTLNKIISLSNDEIIVDVSEYLTSELKNLYDAIILTIKRMGLDCHVNIFTIDKIAQGMYQQTFIGGLSDEPGIKYKKVNHLMMPFVIRQRRGEEPKDSDFVFKNETGQLCRFIENPLFPFSINE